MTINYEEHLRARGQGLRELSVLARVKKNEVASLLGVHEATVRRWNQKNRYPYWAMKAMGLYAGYFPWPGWEGYCVADGLLYCPELNYGYRPEDIQALHWLKQLADYNTRSQ